METSRPPLIRAAGYFCPYCGGYYPHFDPAWSCRDKCAEKISKCKIQPGDNITLRNKHIKFPPLQFDLFNRFRFTVEAIRIQRGLSGESFMFVYDDEDGKEQTVNELYIVEKSR